MLCHTATKRKALTDVIKLAMHPYSSDVVSYKVEANSFYVDAIVLAMHPYSSDIVSYNETNIINCVIALECIHIRATLRYTPTKPIA
jgi:hypothetical protein